MTNYIILSPTLARAMTVYCYALEKLGSMVTKHSRRTHIIETKDGTTLRFMSEEECEKGVRSGMRAEVLSEGYFEKMLDDYIFRMIKVVHIGDVVEFNPFNGVHLVGFKDPEVSIVHGTVVYINEEHKYFTAEYKLGDEVMHSSFKFSDIEDYRRTVTIVKRKGGNV